MIQKCHHIHRAQAHLGCVQVKWKTVLWSDKSKFEILFETHGQYIVHAKRGEGPFSCDQCAVQNPASIIVLDVAWVACTTEKS